MGKKKKATTPATNSAQPALKIGSRVRCGDGATGRITWANAVAVKIKWDDGEEITWRRDSLAWRGLEILAADDEPREKQPDAEPETATAAASPTAQAAATDPEQADGTEPQVTDAATTTNAETPASEPVPPVQMAPEPPAAYGLMSSLLETVERKSECARSRSNAWSS